MASCACKPCDEGRHAECTQTVGDSGLACLCEVCWSINESIPTITPDPVGTPPVQPKAKQYCCPMRARFLIGIVAENKAMPEPVDVIDFMDFDERASDGRPVIKIKFCPFCGKPVKGLTRTP